MNQSKQILLNPVLESFIAPPYALLLYSNSNPPRSLWCPNFRHLPHLAQRPFFYISMVLVQKLRGIQK